MIWFHELVAVLKLQMLLLTCKVTKKHKPGERLGHTVWRCERCAKLYQPPRLFLINVERADRGFWREVA